jgi:hypothetical protein
MLRNGPVEVADNGLIIDGGVDLFAVGVAVGVVGGDAHGVNYFGWNVVDIVLAFGFVVDFIL